MSLPPAPCSLVPVRLQRLLLGWRRGNQDPSHPRGTGAVLGPAKPRWHRDAVHGGRSLAPGPHQPRANPAPTQWAKSSHAGFGDTAWVVAKRGGYTGGRGGKPKSAAAQTCHRQLDPINTGALRMLQILKERKILKKSGILASHQPHNSGQRGMGGILETGGTNTIPGGDTSSPAPCSALSPSAHPTAWQGEGGTRAVTTDQGHTGREEASPSRAPPPAGVRPSGLFAPAAKGGRVCRRGVHGKGGDGHSAQRDAPGSWGALLGWCWGPPAQAPSPPPGPPPPPPPLTPPGK